MQFQVRTFNPLTGQITDRLVEGNSAEDVRRDIAREGQSVLSVVKYRTFSFGATTSFNVVLFCEELRTLLSSGMSVVEVIETLCDKNSAPSTHHILLEIKQRLLEGKTLSASLAMHSYPFPPLLVASIKASEQTSRIDLALDEYIAYELIGRELSKKITSAAIYPSLVVGFGGLVSLFMIGYVVPRFSKVYEDFSQSLSTSTIVLMHIGQFAGNHLMLLIVAIIAGLILLAVLYRNGKLKTFFLKLLSQFAFARRYLRMYQLSRIFQTLSMLLKGGYTVSDAIPLAQNLAFDTQLRAQLTDMRLSILEGKRLSKAFSDFQLTDNVTERLLQVGERSGDLPKVLDIMALSYRQEVTRFIEHTTRLAEPILLMVVGLFIGAIIILMYMPVFYLAGGM